MHAFDTAAATQSRSRQSTSQSQTQDRQQSYDQSTEFSQAARYTEAKVYEDANMDDSGIGMMLDEGFDQKAFDEMNAAAANATGPMAAGHAQQLFSGNLATHKVQ